MGDKDHEDNEDKKNSNNDFNPNEEEKEKSDNSTALLKSARETLNDLRRVTKVSEPNDVIDPSLKDDETNQEGPPSTSNSVDVTSKRIQSNKRSSVSKLIGEDLEKAYKEAKLGNKTVKNSVQITKAKKPKMVYDEEQASLLGAVLGIGERKKDNDEESSQVSEEMAEETSPQTSNNSKTGTKEGLVNITDENSDLNEDSEHKDIKDEDSKQAEKPITSLEKEEDPFNKTENVSKHQEESKDEEKSGSNKSEGILSRLRKMSRRLFC